MVETFQRIYRAVCEVTNQQTTGAVYLFKNKHIPENEKTYKGLSIPHPWRFLHANVSKMTQNQIKIILYGAIDIGTLPDGLEQEGTSIPPTVVENDVRDVFVWLEICNNLQTGADGGDVSKDPKPKVPLSKSAETLLKLAQAKLTIPPANDDELRSKYILIHGDTDNVPGNIGLTQPVIKATDGDVTSGAGSAIFGTSPFANAVGCFGSRTTGPTANPRQQAGPNDDADAALSEYCTTSVDDQRAEEQALALDHQQTSFCQDSQQQQSFLRHRSRDPIHLEAPPRGRACSRKKWPLHLQMVS